MLEQAQVPHSVSTPWGERCCYRNIQTLLGKEHVCRGKHAFPKGVRVCFMVNTHFSNGVTVRDHIIIVSTHFSNDVTVCIMVDINPNEERVPVYHGEIPVYHGESLSLKKSSELGTFDCIRPEFMCTGMDM